MTDGGSAADLLDAFTAWLSEEMAKVPIRSNFQNEVFIRATEKAEVEALRTYRSTRSFLSGLAAGKGAFRLEAATAHSLAGISGETRRAMWAERSIRARWDPPSVG